MQAGLIGNWDALEFRLQLTPTRGRDVGATRHIAQLITHRTASSTAFTEECRLEIRAWRQRAQGFQDYDETAWRVILFGQSYYGSQASFGGYTLILRFINPRWYYKADGEWLFTCDDAEVRNASNTLLHSFGALTRTGSHLAPSGVPLMGVPPLLIPQLDFPPRYSNESIWDDTLQSLRWAGTHSAVAQGGWRVKVGNTWYAFPVDLDVPTPDQEPPSCGGLNPCVLGYTVPDLQANNTYSGRAEIVHRYRTHISLGCLGEERRYGGHLMLLPSLPRAYERLLTPSASLARRLQFPQVRKHDYNRCVYERLATDEYCDQTYEAQPQVLAQADDMVDTLLSSPHDFEDPLQARLRTPVQWFFDWWQLAPESQLTENNNNQIASLCAGGYYNGRFVSESYPRITTNDTPAAYQITATLTALPLLRDWANYVNTWAHPHWLYLALYNDWQLGVPLTNVPAQSYWTPLRTQWLGDIAIPQARRTKHRALQLLGVGETEWQANWTRAIIADNLYGWLGACRFEQLIFPDVESVALNSSSASRWSATGATLSFGASAIQVTPSTFTSVLEFDLTDWQVHPYLYPALATAVRVNITGTVQSVKVYLVNFEGNTVELSVAQGDSTKYLYRASDESVYAGDWAQSYAALLAGYSEVGQDLRTDGRSSSVMGDPVRRTLWELLHSQTPAKLRIEVHQPSPSTYTLAYPIFYREHVSSKAYPITAHTQAVVDHDSLWRYGGLNFQLTTPVPQLRPVHQSPTVYDAYCLRNLLYRGVAYQQDVIADAGQVYDSVEWDGTLAQLRLDTRSLMYPLRARQNPPEPLLILVNAYREVPPLACLPRRKRDGNTLVENGNWGQWQYLLSPMRRYIVNPDTPLHMHKVEYNAQQQETGRQIITTFLESFRRARITYHELALDNNEVLTQWGGQAVNSPRYLLHLQGTDYARATPFHGYSAVIWVAEQLGAAIPLEVDGRRRWVSWGAGSSVHTAHLAGFVAWLMATHSVQEWQCFAWDSRLGALLMTGKQNTTCKLLASYDGGETAQEVLSMNAETLLCEAYSIAGAWVVIYKTSAGVFVRSSTDGGQNWSSPQAAQLDGANMTHTPTGLCYDERAALLLMTYRTAGNQHYVAVSRDLGVTWQTVLP